MRRPAQGADAALAAGLGDAALAGAATGRGRSSTLVATPTRVSAATAWRR
jgi:hypothetical protein